MNTEKGFSYLVRITIGPKKLLMVIRNTKEVPYSVIEVMSKERINKYINETYTLFKHYRNQTSEHYYNKMIKESNFEVEDLNDVEVYDLELNFDDEKIKNNINGKHKTKTIQSKINEEFTG